MLFDVESIPINKEATIILTTYQETASIGDALLNRVMELYELGGYEIRQIPGHEGGRNVVYDCVKEGAEGRILRISFLPDRSREDLLGELEYVRYLFEHGGDVANVIDSKHGRLLEEILYAGRTYRASVFVKAPGKLLAENHYQYRQGVPIREYYENCGRVLGKMHQLSKAYTPIHGRHDFLGKYTPDYIRALIPDTLPLLKEKLIMLIGELTEIERSAETYGMIHFDYNDGNYSIDFNNGQITVYDFDNSCRGWYMFDLASVWTHGVGWAQFEPDAEKRKQLMDQYFAVVLEGYRSETKLDDRMLEKLPLFIRANIMENIADTFEVMQRPGEEQECDERLSYLLACIENDVPYMGFFHEMYSPDSPFELEERDIF